MHGLCNGACRNIGVDVVGMKFLTQPDRTDNGNVVVFKEPFEHLRTDGVNISHVPEVLAIGIRLVDPHKSAVFAAYANGLNAEGFRHGHELFVDLVQDHLCHFHGGLVSHA